VGAAITDRRVLTPVEARIVAAVGTALIVAAVASVLWPRVVAVPLALVASWAGAVLLAKSYHLHRQRRASGAARTRVVAAAQPSGPKLA
jgi:cardiolipin synthase